MENHLRYLELAWAAQRAGLRYTAVSSRLTADEVAYILAGLRVDDRVRERGDRGARARGGGPTSASIVRRRLDYDALVAERPATPLDDEREGGDFLYSSGTTGRPKAISAPLPLHPIGTPPAIVPLFEKLYGFGGDTVYLSPAPLYHSAPLRFNMAVHRLGGTTIVMDRFDPAWTLELIERYRVTHTQMVPTMFVRLLRLPEDERAARPVVAARGRPRRGAVPAGRQGGDDRVARPDHLRVLLGDRGLPAHRDRLRGLARAPRLGRQGAARHAAHPRRRRQRARRPASRARCGPRAARSSSTTTTPRRRPASRNDRGWTTVGDIGYLDAEGYLYLTDRKADMIISGGVNVYPQEAENVLIGHPAVDDVAVFGIPQPGARRGGQGASCSCAPATGRRPSSRPS